jgi:predicted outer membrane repeat protein
MHRIWLLLTLFALLLTTLLLQPAPVHADDAVVGTGTPGSCTESAFDSALTTVQNTGGGTITFNCGGDATIVFSARKTISEAVIIDGGGTITFDGNNLTSFFQIFNDASLTLNDLVLQRGAFNGVHALENFGALTLNNVTMSQHVSNGSPISNIGTLIITNSTFSDNGLTGDNETSGGVVFHDGGTLTVTGSTFNNNIINGNVGTGGAIAVINGTATISDTVFTSNRALDGGAIYLDTGGSATITGSTFTTNIGGYGGAIESNGMILTVTESTFDGNDAVIGSGGAIWLYNGTENVISDSTFTDNSTVTTGGAIHCFAAGLSITGSTFSGNEALNTNSVPANGGGIFSTCTIDVRNSTFSSNTAEDGGGAFYQEGSRAATLEYVTIADNTADFGAGIYNDGDGTSTLTIRKSIVAYNTKGNCAGVITSNGYNLSDDTYCGVFTQTGDVQNANVPLLPLGNYGGLTATRPPAPDSEALDHIPTASCGATEDQRGVARPQAGGCDSGAVEGTVYKLFLSLIRRE